MTHVVSGTIRKPPFVKENCGQDGQSKMYAIELSEMTKDWQTGEKQYANYKALFFAKTDAAKGYYDKAFAENSFVVVSCEKLKVEQREHNGSIYVSLVMDNARLEGARFEEASPVQQQYNQQPQQPMQQQQPAQQQQQAYNPHQQQQSPQQWQQNQQQQVFDDYMPF